MPSAACSVDRLQAIRSGINRSALLSPQVSIVDHRIVQAVQRIPPPLRVPRGHESHPALACPMHPAARVNRSYPRPRCRS